MKKLLTIAIMALVCGGVLLSCNEKPKSYKFVKVFKDGNQDVEEFTAKNDTDALNLYFDRMEKVIVANLEKSEEPFEAMYVISPEGDTLNTNEELLKVAMKSIPTQQAPSQQAPMQPMKQQMPLKPMPAN